VTSSTDVDNEVTTETDYDVFGRPVEVRVAANLPDLMTVTRTEYDDAERRVIVRSDLDAAYDGKLLTVRHFDQLGRVRLTRQLEDSDLSATDETVGIKVQTRYSYSGSNSYKLVSNPYRAATSAAAGAEATMGWTRSKADKGGRTAEVRSYSGSGLPAPWGTNAATTGAATTAYDANSTTITDQAGKVRREVTDALERLIRVDEPNTNNSLGSVTAPALPTNYTYDALGKLTGVSQGVQTRTFTYSSLSRLVSALNPEANDQQSTAVAVKYEYDNNGNLTKKTDARGSEINYEYDGLNRPTRRWYTGSIATPEITYTYDDAGLYSKGRLTSVSSSVSATNYTGYDALGRVTASSQVTGGVTYSMPEYRYDRAGHLLSQKYPSGRVVTNSYDKAGRLLQVNGQTPGTTTSKLYASQISYGAQGGATEMKLGNNLWEHTVFNERLQPVLIGLGTSQATPNPQDFNRFRVDYAYGGAINNGNVTQQTVSVPDAAGTYVAQMAQTYT
jgi:YD repeat-containing protein